MKKLLSTLTLLSVAWIGTHAQADTLSIAKWSHADMRNFDRIELRFDAEKGTAVYQGQFSYSYGGGGGNCGESGGCTDSTQHYTLNAPVKGLWFDSASSRILFDGAQGRVVCATTYLKTRRFRKPVWMINSTGQCRAYTQTIAGGMSEVFFEAN